MLLRTELALLNDPDSLCVCMLGAGLGCSVIGEMGLNTVGGWSPLKLPSECLRLSRAYGNSALLNLFSIESRLLPSFSLSPTCPPSSPRALSSALLGSGGTGGISVGSGLSANRWKGCSPRGSVALSWRVIPLRYRDCRDSFVAINEFTRARASVVPDTDDERSSVTTEFGLAGREGPLLFAPGTGRCVCPPADPLAER